MPAFQIKHGRKAAGRDNNENEYTAMSTAMNDVGFFEWLTSEVGTVICSAPSTSLIVIQEWYQELSPQPDNLCAGLFERDSRLGKRCFGSSSGLGCGLKTRLRRDY